jgi:hypothetical protein
MFRELPGTRPQRLKILKEMYISNGTYITQDRLDAMIKMAQEEEKKVTLLRIKKLIHKGMSLSDIASTLNVPKSTVARYARGAKQGTARVKRSVLSLAERSSGPSSSSGPTSTLPPRPGVA